MRELELNIQVDDRRHVSGFYHVPNGFEAKKTAAVIVGHGAGNDCRGSLIVEIARTLARAGYAALRFNFPYREEGRKMPDPQKVLEETYLASAAAVKTHPDFPSGPLVLSGKSMGGRIASQVCERIPDSRALIFFGYPLHPPGRPEKLRDAHLAGLKLPMLFIQGARDALCNLDLLKPVLKRLFKAALVTIQGADHSYKLPKSDPRTAEQVFSEVTGSAVRWLDAQRLD
jgi:predicted alpha/beta-hydrolase family hydrolase